MPKKRGILVGAGLLLVAVVTVSCLVCCQLILGPKPVAIIQYTLTINSNSPGSGTTDPPEGSHTYDAGAVVSVSATPNEGYEFSHWSSDATGTDPSTSITMDCDKDVTANFALPGITLIGAIKQNPAAYEGHTVLMKGQYRGWEVGHGSPPVTRSDWIIQDNSGSIYVTGELPGLKPYEDIGKPIQVEGVVRLKDGLPYIEAKTTGDGREFVP